MQEYTIVPERMSASSAAGGRGRKGGKERERERKRRPAYEREANK